MVKLEEGKYYRTRDGRKVGPLVMHPNYSLCGAEGWGYSVDSYWYTDKEYAGRTQKSQENEEDLVAEWVEETTMDIYSLEKPLGMYPYEIRDALYAHTESGGKVQSWGGWGWALCEEPAFNPNLTYRAVKKPEVIEVTVHVGPNPTPMGAPWLFGMGGKTVVDTHKITFNLVEGVPDCNSIKMVALSDQSKPSF
jgi:hypothetical protein